MAILNIRKLQYLRKGMTDFDEFGTLMHLNPLDTVSK